MAYTGPVSLGDSLQHPALAKDNYHCPFEPFPRAVEPRHAPALADQVEHPAIQHVSRYGAGYKQSQIDAYPNGDWTYVAWGDHVYTLSCLDAAYSLTRGFQRFLAGVQYDKRGILCVESTKHPPCLRGSSRQPYDVMRPKREETCTPTTNGSLH